MCISQLVPHEMLLHRKLFEIVSVYVMLIVYTLKIFFFKELRDSLVCSVNGTPLIGFE